MPTAKSASDDAEEPELTRALATDIVEEAGAWDSFDDIECLVDAVAAAIARHPRLSALMPAEACIALTDDAAMRRLNHQFRAKDKPTNVLSFPSALPAGITPRPLGDIAIGYETIMREAAEQAIAPADHLRHLVAHGLLHLLGYDHESDAEAEEMEAIEIEVLASLGIDNPYAETTTTLDGQP